MEYSPSEMKIRRAQISGTNGTSQKPASTAKALHNLKPKPRGYIQKINFPSAVNNPRLETYTHQVHFSETPAFNLKHFLASEMV